MPLPQNEFDSMFQQASNMQKSMLKRFWPFMLASALFSIGGIIAVVFGVIWCLKHFGVI